MLKLFNKCLNQSVGIVTSHNLSINESIRFNLANLSIHCWQNLFYHNRLLPAGHILLQWCLHLHLSSLLTGIHPGSFHCCEMPRAASMDLTTYPPPYFRFFFLKEPQATWSISGSRGWFCPVSLNWGVSW